MSIAGEPTSGLEPLTSSHYECALIRSWVFLSVPKTAYLSHLCLFRVSLCSPSFARITVAVTVNLIRSQPERYVVGCVVSPTSPTRGLLLETPSVA